AAGNVIAGGTTDGTTIMVPRYIAATGLVDGSNGFNVSGTFFDGTAPSAVAIETQGSGDIVVGGVSTNDDDDLYIIHLAQ
ncbi:MAG: hypothetical protein OXT09_29560, partial [Myxococcales bacterium]|nr:hypothetical protein [Myxococcales bacterium]